MSSWAGRLVALGRSLHPHLGQFVGEKAPLEAGHVVGLRRLGALSSLLCGFVPGFGIWLRVGFGAAQYGRRCRLLLLPLAGERVPESRPARLRLRRGPCVRGGPRRQRAAGLGRVSPAERPEERTKRGDKVQAPAVGQEEPEGGQVTWVGRETGGPPTAQRHRKGCWGGIVSGD